MKRSGFTMVELIFVIVIIGILAATALPRFGGVKDNAKANSEIAAMSSLEGSIAAAVEFQLQDYNNRDVNWHDKDLTGAGTTAIYQNINSNQDVLKKIMKKGDKFKITGFAQVNSDTNATYDVLTITGEASDSANGIKEPTDGDIVGKPDRSDYWVFNPNNFDLNVSSANIVPNGYVEVPAESITLVDFNGTTGTVAIDNLQTSGDEADTVTSVN